MQFSFIVPIYNVANYLNKCIESLECQQGVEYEVILVDDGSTDQSGKMCDDFCKKYSNIKVIHKRNGGLSEARNVGIKMAKGEYILFVDGDDYIASNSLKKIEEIVFKCNKPDIICLELIKFFENSEKIIEMKDGIDENIYNLKDSSLYEYLACLPKYPASACTKAIKRELFLHCDLYFIQGILSEDLEWCIRLFLSAKTFAYCSAPYYFYRQARAGSISNTLSEKKVRDITNTFIKWVDYAKGLQDFSQKKMVCSYMEYIFRFLILGYKTIPTEAQKELKRILKTRKWVLGTRQDLVSKIIYYSYKGLGIKLTSAFLKKYLKIRGY